jgi:hypothetical protein
MQLEESGKVLIANCVDEGKKALVCHFSVGIAPRRMRRGEAQDWRT